ncbi:hypothetical protein SLEP1_g13002 [Rubroshorea leprosula]|uniref:Transmembrane protein n=1 Tax=Rubroshorea leprosula TaxID=152421 RepID=A0AAV5INT0_9ROSI|nr:hypothetical protein SLEP1_g13002 [Rubroshorea leprosula]
MPSSKQKKSKKNKKEVVVVAKNDVVSAALVQNSNVMYFQISILIRGLIAFAFVPSG